MMREYKIENVAELRKLLTKPPHPKYLRRDEINANQLEFEKYISSRRRGLIMKLLRYFSAIVMLVFTFGIISMFPFMFLIGAVFLAAGLIDLDWHQVLIGVFLVAVFGAAYKEWRGGYKEAWRLFRSSEFRLVK